VQQYLFSSSSDYPFVAPSSLEGGSRGLAILLKVVSQRAVFGLVCVSSRSPVLGFSPDFPAGLTVWLLVITVVVFSRLKQIQQL